jgi:hypothetical protein
LNWASDHLSFVVVAVFASPMQREASSNWTRSAKAFAKTDEKTGTNNDAPVMRKAVRLEVIILRLCRSEQEANFAPTFPKTFEFDALFSSAKQRAHR